MTSALDIVKYALKCGFEKCGIIPVDRMRGYELRLDERMARFPEIRSKTEGFRSFTNPQEEYPWAKSIVVCAYWYGKYRIPAQLEGRIGRHYLVDGRQDENAPEHMASRRLEAYLNECGIRTACERDFGITALRWAAKEAGIGIIRKNNFFYGEKGSRYSLEAFLIDRELEHREECALKPCGDNCSLCMRACPTQSLAGPYAMNRNTCVSCLTTWDAWDLRKEPLREKIGDWIYGCDACQDACPHNRNAWEAAEDFLGLEELAQKLTLEQIVRADYVFLERVLQPKFWYIPADRVWRFKVNALSAMLNNYRPEYRECICEACHDANEHVREMAAWVLDQL